MATLTRKLTEFMSFSRLAKKNDYPIRTKILFCAVIDATSYIAKNLNIDPQQSVFVLKRLRYLQDKPVSIETSYFSQKTVYGIEKVDFTKEQLYQILEKKYKITISSSKEEILIVKATKEESGMLKLPYGSTLTMIKGHSFDQNYNQVEYFESLSLTDLYVFEA